MCMSVGCIFLGGGWGNVFCSAMYFITDQCDPVFLSTFYKSKIELNLIQIFFSVQNIVLVLLFHHEIKIDSHLKKLFSNKYIKAA